MKIKNKKILKKISTAKRVCVLGIGNFDRADDFVGIAVVEQLEKRKYDETIKIINAGPVPEAFTGVIKSFLPDLLVVIDAAEMDEKPGTVRAFTEKDIDEAYMITPHKTSMKMYTKYLRFFLEELDAIFIGIQPESLSYGVPMSKEVKESVDFLIEYFDVFLSRKE